MNEDTLDDTNVIDPTPADAQSAPDQENTPDPVSDDDAAKSTEESQEATQKEPSRAEKRIQQLVGDRNHAMEYGDFWKDKYEQSQQAAPAPKEDKPAPVMPKLEDFDYDQDAYNVSMQNWNSHQIAEQVKVGVAEAMEQSGQQTAAQQVDANWQANVAEFSKEHGDFAQVAFATEGIYDAIKAHPDGPAIAYHLGQNPEEAARIGNLSPSQLPFELGRLELSSKPAVAQKQVTNAPDPMSPVGGGQPTLSTANETMDDFMARRNEEEAEARRTRGTGRV